MISLFLNDVIEALPPLHRTVVVLMAIVAGLVLLNAVTEFEPSDLRWTVGAVVAGFFLIDLFWIHPGVWSNAPALTYWIAKPFWVGGGMFFAAFLIDSRTDAPMWASLLIGGLFGIIVLQVYYGIVPLELVEGPSVQLGLVESLGEGFRVHGAGILLSLGVVLALMWAIE